MPRQENAIKSWTKIAKNFKHFLNLTYCYKCRLQQIKEDNKKKCSTTLSPCQEHRLFPGFFRNFFWPIIDSVKGYNTCWSIIGRLRYWSRKKIDQFFKISTVDLVNYKKIVIRNFFWPIIDSVKGDNTCWSIIGRLRYWSRKKIGQFFKISTVDLVNYKKIVTTDLGFNSQK